jgi:hypothetical protein
MKVIFLDFDGVLNSATSFLHEHNRRKVHKEQGVKGPINQTLSLHCCAAFQEVLNKYPDVKVVLSTTWRTMFDLQWLKEKLSEYHIDSSRVIGITPEPRITGDRGHEIADWLSQHPEVTHYAIIDDNDWGIIASHGEDRFVHTDWDRGMGLNHAIELMKKLSANNQKAVEERLAKEKAEDEKAAEERAKTKDEKPDNDF